MALDPAAAKRRIRQLETERTALRHGRVLLLGEIEPLGAPARTGGTELVPAWKIYVPIALALGLLAGVLLPGALGGGESLPTAAEPVPPPKTAVATPDGEIELPLGTLDPETAVFLGRTQGAVFIDATDAESGDRCLAIFRADSDGPAAGCDRPGGTHHQYIQYSTADGMTAVGYRSFVPIISATVDGVAVEATRGLVAFEVPPSSTRRLRVETTEGTFTESIRTGATLADTLDLEGRANP